MFHNVFYNNMTYIYICTIKYSAKIAISIYIYSFLLTIFLFLNYYQKYIYVLISKLQSKNII